MTSMIYTKNTSGAIRRLRNKKPTKGYLSALVDAGAGTAAHRCADNAPCVTISLDLKFISASKIGDEIIGHVKILKKTKTLVFLFCELKCNNKIITSASGVWKILKV